MNFTLYADDSGTSPSQRVAIATALVIPTYSVPRLEGEWNEFLNKEKLTSFHTSEFVARNPKSEFASLTDDDQKRIFARVQQISKKYGVVAASVAVNKKSYDDIVLEPYRELIGKYHYTFAIRWLTALVDQWRKHSPKVRGLPLEYVFDWMGEPKDERRKEIEDVMKQSADFSKELGKDGDYENYSFRKRIGIPGLQCVDAIGWVCYQYALGRFYESPLHEFVEPAWNYFEGDRGPTGWLRAITFKKEALQKWYKNESEDGRSMKRFLEWKVKQSATAQSA